MCTWFASQAVALTLQRQADFVCRLLHLLQLDWRLRFCEGKSPSPSETSRGSCEATQEDSVLTGPESDGLAGYLSDSGCDSASSVDQLCVPERKQP